MNVLIWDEDSGRRAHLRDALCWMSDEVRCVEATDAADALSALDQMAMRIVVVGHCMGTRGAQRVRMLRQRLPQGAIILAGMQMSSGDRDGVTLLLKAGVSVVFDERMSTSQLALILQRFCKEFDDGLERDFCGLPGGGETHPGLARQPVPIRVLAPGRLGGLP